MGVGVMLKITIPVALAASVGASMSEREVHAASGGDVDAVYRRVSAEAPLMLGERRFACLLEVADSSGATTGLSLRITTPHALQAARAVIRRAGGTRVTTVEIVRPRFSAKAMTTVIRRVRALLAPFQATSSVGLAPIDAAKEPGRCRPVQIGVDETNAAALAAAKRARRRYGGDRVKVHEAPAGSPVPTGARYPATR
jgi:hypothetical protein